MKYCPLCPRRRATRKESSSSLRNPTSHQRPGFHHCRSASSIVYFSSFLLCAPISILCACFRRDCCWFPRLCLSFSFTASVWVFGVCLGFTISFCECVSVRVFECFTVRGCSFYRTWLWVAALELHVSLQIGIEELQACRSWRFISKLVWIMRYFGLLVLSCTFQFCGSSWLKSYMMSFYRGVTYFNLHVWNWFLGFVIFCAWLGGCWCSVQLCKQRIRRWVLHQSRFQIFWFNYLFSSLYAFLSCMHFECYAV
jgi:hypothetical protein